MLVYVYEHVCICSVWYDMLCYPYPRRRQTAAGTGTYTHIYTCVSPTTKRPYLQPVHGVEAQGVARDVEGPQGGVALEHRGDVAHALRFDMVFVSGGGGGGGRFSVGGLLFFVGVCLYPDIDTDTHQHQQQQQ